MLKGNWLSFLLCYSKDVNLFHDDRHKDIFIFIKIFYSFMCIGILSAHVCLPHVLLAPCRDQKTPLKLVTNGYEPLCRSWELNPDPLPECGASIERWDLG